MFTKKIQKEREKNISFQKLSQAIIFPFTFLIFLVFINGIFLFFDNFFLSNWLYLLLTFFLNNIFIFVSIFAVYIFSKNKKIEIIPAFLVSIFIFFILQNVFINHDLFFFSNQKLYLVRNTFYLQTFSLLFLPLLLLSITFAYFFNKYYEKIKYWFFVCFFIFTCAFSLFFILILPLFFFIFFQSILIVIKMPFGFDSFFYGFFNRFLAISGLQTLLNATFNYSTLGGQVISQNNGVVAQGEVQIWFFCVKNGLDFNLVRDASMSGEMYNGYFFTYGLNPGQYQQGILPIIIFAFPAIGFAFYNNIEDKKQAKKILLLSFVPLFTGLTEPIEILFIPYFPLYIFYCFLTGINFMILDLLGVSVIISMGTIFDLIIFGILPQVTNLANTNYQYIFFIGLFDFCIIYLVFNFYFKSKKIVFNYV